MATDEELRAKLNERIASQIDLEVAKLKKEAAEVRDPPRWSGAKRAGGALLKHLPTLGLIVTAAIGILAYHQGQIERKRETFNDLVARLVDHRALESYDVYLTFSTLSAMRERYANEPDYAFEVAFITLPYVFLDKSEEDLRLFAARTLSEAVGHINDVEQHYRLNGLFYRRLELFASNLDDMTPLVVAYTRLVMCTLTESSFRNDVPEKGDREQCEEWRRNGELPFET